MVLCVFWDGRIKGFLLLYHSPLITPRNTTALVRSAITQLILILFSEPTLALACLRTHIKLLPAFRVWHLFLNLGWSSYCCGTCVCDALLFGVCETAFCIPVEGLLESCGVRLKKARVNYSMQERLHRCSRNIGYALG